MKHILKSRKEREQGSEKIPQIGCQNIVTCVVYWEKAGLDSCGADPALSKRKQEKNEKDSSRAVNISKCIDLQTRDGL